jgi:hypothetical protein
MNVETFYCVQDAVRLAKQYQIKTVDGLRGHLSGLGYKPETVQNAIEEWANYEASKRDH